MNKRFLNITVILLTIILSGLPMIPDDETNPFLIWVKDNSFNITKVVAGVVILLHLLDWGFQWDRNKKRWLRTFLKHIVDEHLCGDTYQTRISIMRKQRGYIVFLKTLWHHVFVNFINNFKESSWKSAFKSIAIHLFSDYLIVYVRYSYPKSKKNCTYFRLSDKAHKRKYNGMADRCFQEGVENWTSTVNISHINLPLKQEELSPKDKKDVERYMRDCHFSKEHYDSLRNMHKVSNNLYAVPIALNDQTIWGVVIVDSSSDTKHNYQNDLNDCMASYMKIISFSLSSLK